MKPTPEQIAKLPKWAQSHIRDLQDEVSKLSGLLDTPKIVGPDLEPPSVFSEIRNGWTYNSYNLKGGSLCGVASAVDKACTGSGFHSIGKWDRTDSQRPIHLYSTPKKAWADARAEFIQWCGLQLAEIDKMLEAASDEAAPQKPKKLD